MKVNTILKRTFEPADRKSVGRWLTPLRDCPKIDAWVEASTASPEDVRRLCYYELGHLNNPEGNPGPPKSEASKTYFFDVLKEINKACERQARRHGLHEDDVMHHLQRRLVGFEPLDELMAIKPPPWPAWKPSLERLQAAGFNGMTRLPVKWLAGRIDFLPFIRLQALYAARAAQFLTHKTNERLQALHAARVRQFLTHETNRKNQGIPKKKPEEPESAECWCYRRAIACYQHQADRLVQGGVHQGRRVGAPQLERAAGRLLQGVEKIREQQARARAGRPPISQIDVILWTRARFEIPISTVLQEFKELGLQPSPSECLCRYLAGWMDTLENLAKLLRRN